MLKIKVENLTNFQFKENFDMEIDKTYVEVIYFYLIIVKTRVIINELKKK